MSDEQQHDPDDSRHDDDKFVEWHKIGGVVGNLNCRVALLEEESTLLKQKLLDIEAYFQSGRR